MPDSVRAPREPGTSTGSRQNVTYRLRKLTRLGIVHGEWLDCGCGDGSYSLGLLQAGADGVVGLDIMPDRVEGARARFRSERLAFVCSASERLPFADGSFDGVLLNEVLEHVDDEEQTLAEARRVMRPGGSIAVFSPNRWFPFEGHGVSFGRWRFDKPTPLVPWLPSALTAPIVHARNYWPSELRALVEKAGFSVVAQTSVFPVLEFYPWLPSGLIPSYRRMVPMLEQLPVLRRFGVSTLVVGRKVTAGPVGTPRRLPEGHGAP